MNIEYIYKLFEQCNNTICTDTRKIIKNSLFIALKGEYFNANNFVEEAIKLGCKYAISDEYIGKNEKIIVVENTLQTLQQLSIYHRNKMKAKVIGIAGSNGKTTTKELISAVLSKKYKITHTIGNYNNHIGVPLTLLQIKPETQIAIVEMGANQLNELEILCKIADPDYGIVTNLGLEHLEGFGSFEGVIKTETYLYRHLEQKNGLVFVNINDNVLMNYIGNNAIYTYGNLQNANVILINQEVNPFVKVQWKFNSQNEINTVQTQLIGSYNCENILAAISVGTYFNVPNEQIKKAIEKYIPSNHRSQLIKTKTNTIIMDAYNANPTSMQLSIENFNALQLKNKVLIIGDMLELGNYEEEEHKNILNIIKQYHFEKVFLVGTVFFRLSKNDFFKFRDVDKLKEYLTSNPIKNSSILLKGSHGIHLEKLLEVLTNE